MHDTSNDKNKTTTVSKTNISTQNTVAAASAQPGYSGFYSAYVLLMLFLGSTLSFADRQLINILVEPIKQEFDASDTEMGVLTGLAFVLFYATMSMPIARLADRSSRRNILAIAMAVWSAMTALCGMSVHFWQLALARFGVGVGEAGGGPASYSMLADYFSPQRRSTALGILTAAAPVGILLSMYGGAIIATHYGWRATFLALGIPGILLAMLIWTTVREPQRGGWDAPQRQIEANLGMRQVMLLLWRNPALRNIALASGVTAISGYATAAWMPSFFMRVHGLSLIEAGLALGLGGTLGGIAGGIIGGILADRLSKRDVSWQLKIAAIGTLLTVPVQTLVLLWPHHDVLTIGGMQLPVAVIGVPFSGFFLAFMQGPSIAAVQNVAAPEIRTQASAAFFFISSILGMTFGPLSVGVLNDLLTPLVAENAVRYGLLGSLIFMLLGALLFWRSSYFYAEILMARALASK